ncbi:hypothetical protein [Roseomonas chloroacetimidivorans]|jgi:hypothetical protein|uniref:hypothetical protein n=1 Tax=Roseomonas chloroacetimidivorans TaxID=1766656 RepID=UPI003C73DE8F
MAGLFWLTKAPIRRIAPYFPLCHRVRRTDDQRVVNGIIHVMNFRRARRRGG